MQALLQEILNIIADNDDRKIHPDIEKSKIA
jgi:hypothetical protein